MLPCWETAIMALETFFALLTFALVASITPGPNNLMLLASGVNFGFRRTIPHMCGIAVGFFILLMSVGLGLGTLLSVFPALHTGLKLAGGAYLIYLSWRIATTRTMGKGKASAKPMTLLGAAAFQWVNPKAWMMAVSAMALFTDPSQPYLSVFWVALAFVIVNFPSVSTWAGFGTLMSGFLSNPVRLKWFNIAMGCILALTVVPMVR